MDPQVILQRQQLEREELAKVHPGFRTASSVVLHRFGTDANYAAWRHELAADSTFGRDAMGSGGKRVSRSRAPW